MSGARQTPEWFTVTEEEWKWIFGVETLNGFDINLELRFPYGGFWGPGLRFFHTVCTADPEADLTEAPNDDPRLVRASELFDRKCKSAPTDPLVSALLIATIYC